MFIDLDKGEIHFTEDESIDFIAKMLCELDPGKELKVFIDANNGNETAPEDS